MKAAPGLKPARKKPAEGRAGESLNQRVVLAKHSDKRDHV
jgi:hypothetical protein